MLLIIQQMIRGNGKTHVVKALSPLKPDRCVITLIKISWDASSAS